MVTAFVASLDVTVPPDAVVAPETDELGTTMVVDVIRADGATPEVVRRGRVAVTDSLPPVGVLKAEVSVRMSLSA